MAKKGNSKRASFLSTIPQISLNATENDLAQRCKLNFSYFVNSDDAGQNFNDWTKEELVKLLEKLKEYSKFSLSHWKTKKVGNSNTFRFDKNTFYVVFLDKEHKFYKTSR